MEIQRRQFNNLLLIIAIGAVLIRWIALWLRISSLDSTAFEFGEIARSLVAGRGFAWDFWGMFPMGPTAYMAPFYAWLLAAYYWLFGFDLTGMAALQGLVLGGVCWSLGRIGLALGGASVGLLAAFILAVYPEGIFMPQKFTAEPWLLLWQVLFVLIAIKYQKTGQRKHVITAGLLAGIAILTKESALLFVPLLLVWIGLQMGFTRRLIKDTIVMAAIAICIVAPWTLRNYLVFDEFIPIRTNFWINMWRGNHPGATGTARSWDKRPIDFALDSSYAKEVNSQLIGNEVQREEVYKRFAKSFISEHPWECARLSLRRFWYYWTIDPTHPLTDSVLYWGPWFILLGFVTVGIYSVRARWRVYSWFFLLIVITTMTYTLTIILPRYRIPLLPGLVLLASEGMVFFAGFLRKRT
ncbi:MAG: glycosyltransferase family 39 protein [bacterium]